MAEKEPLFTTGPNGCRFFKGYMLGSDGGLIWECKKCGEEHFRFIGLIDLHPLEKRKEYCHTCIDTEMSLIHKDDLETVWYPLWKKHGYEAHPGSAYESWLKNHSTETEE